MKISLLTGKHFVMALLAAFLIASSLAGQVNPEPPPAAPASLPPSPKALKLAFVTNNAGSFWTVVGAGVKHASTEIPNLEVQFKVLAAPDAEAQKKILTDLANAPIDGIAVSPIDPANQTAFLNEMAAKTLLITQDADAPKSNRAFYVGIDNVAAGKQAGELLKKALPAGGTVMLFAGIKEAQNARDRAAGIKSALEGSHIEILGILSDSADPARAHTNVADTLVKHPDIAGLVGLWSYNGPAILRAVKEANKLGKIKIVCFDENQDVLDAVKRGEIEGTICQQPFELGRRTIELMAQVLRGQKPNIPENKRVIIPMQVIDKTRVDAFSAKIKDWLDQ